MPLMSRACRRRAGGGAQDADGREGEQRSNARFRCRDGEIKDTSAREKWSPPCSAFSVLNKKDSPVRCAHARSCERAELRGWETPLSSVSRIHCMFWLLFRRPDYHIGSPTRRPGRCVRRARESGQPSACPAKRLARTSRRRRRRRAARLAAVAGALAARLGPSSTRAAPRRQLAPTRGRVAADTSPPSSRPGSARTPGITQQRDARHLPRPPAQRDRGQPYRGGARRRLPRGPAARRSSFSVVLGRRARARGVPVVRRADGRGRAQGRDSLLFAYGQTGAGDLMYGAEGRTCRSSTGWCPRRCRAVPADDREEKDTVGAVKYALYATLVAIQGANCYDLLADVDREGNQPKVGVLGRRCSATGWSGSTRRAADAIERGMSTRTTPPTSCTSTPRAPTASPAHPREAAAAQGRPVAAGPADHVGGEDDVQLLHDRPGGVGGVRLQGGRLHPRHQRRPRPRPRADGQRPTCSRTPLYRDRACAAARGRARRRAVPAEMLAFAELGHRHETGGTLEYARRTARLEENDDAWLTTAPTAARAPTMASTTSRAPSTRRRAASRWHMTSSTRTRR